jgi:hypothetical protein
MFLAKKKKIGVKLHQMARANSLSRAISLSPTKGKGTFSATSSPTINVPDLKPTVATREVSCHTRDSPLLD